MTGDMTLEEAQRRVTEFLTQQMLQALRAVEYDIPPFDTEPGQTSLAEAARAEVAVRHVVGASDAVYLVGAFGDELLVQVQLNVHRFVVIYRIPAMGLVDAEALSPRFAMWQRGATHVGWAMHWRDAAAPTRRISGSSRFTATPILFPASCWTSPSNCSGAPTSRR